ncbi:MAG: hypothetical protein AAF223_10150 [Bacteroidota bacterium]
MSKINQKTDTTSLSTQPSDKSDNPTDINLNESQFNAETVRTLLNHHVRGPLARLKGLLLLVASSEDPDQQTHYLTLAQQLLEEQDTILITYIEQLNEGNSS